MRFLWLNSAQNFSNTLKNRVPRGSRFLAIDGCRSVRGHWAPRLHMDRSDQSLAIFWPKLTVLRVFGPPQRGWDLWFSLRPFVRPFVRPAEISKSVHRNFLIFGTKLGLPNATELTFSDFARKIPFGRFWPTFGKKLPFLAKNQRFSQFLKMLS